MKKIKIVKEIEYYFEECDKCNQRIKGRTENQVNYWMGVHQLSKKCKQHK